MPMTNLHVLTDSNGEFDAGWAPDWAGDLEEFFIMARHVERNLAGGIEIDKDTETVRIKLEPALKLTGVVEDPNGIPIAGSSVGLSLHSHASAAGYGCGTPVGPTLADDTGCYEFKALPQKREWIIRASADGYWPNRISTGVINRITDSEEVGPIILKKPNRSVSGVVVDEVGKPVANC